MSNTIEFNSAQFVTIEFELASTAQRVLAALLDIAIFIVYFILLVVTMDLSSFFTNYGTMLFIWLLIIKLPWIFYNPVMELFFKGQTIGKMILGIRVVTLDGERPGLREVFTRWLFRGDFIWISADFLVLLWLGFGILGIIFSSISDKNQRMGDVLAQTVVIRTKPSMNYKLKDILAIKSQENYEPIYKDVIIFTDEDMMLIKNSIQRVKQYPNPETNKFVIELAHKTAEMLNLSETPQKKLEFLQTVLEDYVVLTR